MNAFSKASASELFLVFAIIVMVIGATYTNRIGDFVGRARIRIMEWAKGERS